MTAKLFVCTQRRQAPNPHSCGNSGSDKLVDRLQQEISAAGLQVSVVQSPCLSMCQNGPNIRLLPDGKNWHRVGSEEVRDIVDFLRAREK